MIHLLASCLLAIGLVLASTSWPPSSDKLPLSHASLSAPPLFEPGLKALLPRVYFCGESVPIHEEAVARQLVSALIRNTSHNQTLFRIRQRAAVFFPVIEPILSQHGIPLDFKYLPLVESALQGFAVSPKGAVGYWQFMPATARELGLTVNRGIDERQHLIKSTNAACRYLRYLYERLGSWTLAAAAYNNGIGALLSNIRRQQQRDYYYLRLNAETGKYLYRILAFKELLSNYRSYRHLISDETLASLIRPLRSLPDETVDTADILIPEAVLTEATEKAIDTPIDSKLTPTNGQTIEIPLPNAADVFRGGIKAKLAEPSGLQPGQVWVFHLIRDGLAGSREVEEGDILYAVIEDIDEKTNKVYLRSDQLYSRSDKRTYPLTLSAVDASTGRMGIQLSDLSRLQLGWILTWKAL